MLVYNSCGVGAWWRNVFVSVVMFLVSCYKWLCWAHFWDLEQRFNCNHVLFACCA